MIEVFKTNVRNTDHANMLVNLIQDTFGGYEVNFDLEDCDKILRVKTSSTVIQSDDLIRFLSRFGVSVKVLHDNLT